MPTPTVITDLSPIAASNSPAGSDAPSVLDDVQRAHAAFIRQLLNAVQPQTYTAFTTAGTATAYTLATSPTAPALVAGQRFRVKLHLANGLNPTISRDGLLATTLKVFDAVGAKVAPAAGALPTLFDAEYDGVDYVVFNRLPVVTSVGTGLTLVNGALAATATVSKFIQAVEATPFTTASSTTVILPLDDTIPQITEGAELQTVTITPTSATSRLRVEFQGYFATSTSAGYVSAALFQGAIADALTAAGNTMNDNVAFVPLTLSFEMAAGTTSAITFRVRYGPSVGTGYVNQNGSPARRFGGVMRTTFRVTEMAA